MPDTNRQQSLSDFFHLTVKLLHEFSWVYDFKGTDILKDGVRCKIPPTFQDLFQRFEENDKQFHNILGLEDDGLNAWPPELNRFISICKRLRQLSEEIKSPPLSFISEDISESQSSAKLQLPRKWNPKKYFEVIHVGNFVGEMCVRERCDVAIDIGSGLGYLCSHLANQFKIRVVGIESVASRVETANNKSYVSNFNFQDQSVTASAPQTFVCLRISENISEELEPHIGKHKRVCLTALHACGDLTPWSLKHFLSTETCKCIAVVPCCYHKMDVNGPNFPMSFQMKEVLSKYEDACFLKNPWLWRLACQRSGSDFLGDVEKETRNMFYRALLEKFCAEENLVLIRKKRKCQDSKVGIGSFAEYLERTVGSNGGFAFVETNGSECTEDARAGAISRLGVLHDEFHSWSRVITGILAMQGVLQPIAEDLILLDRLQLLLESDVVKECGIIKVIPDNVSPRGMVLFGVK